MVEIGEADCVYDRCWWILDMPFFYFAENYSQQDFWCSFLQQMVQFTAPSGNMPLSKSIWSACWQMLSFKMNLWGDLRVFYLPAFGQVVHADLWGCCDRVSCGKFRCSCCSWRSLYSCDSSNAMVPLWVVRLMVIMARSPYALHLVT